MKNLSNSNCQPHQGLEILNWDKKDPEGEWTAHLLPDSGHLLLSLDTIQRPRSLHCATSFSEPTWEVLYGIVFSSVYLWIPLPSFCVTRQVCLERCLIPFQVLCLWISDLKTMGETLVKATKANLPWNMQRLLGFEGSVCFQVLEIKLGCSYVR